MSSDRQSKVKKLFGQPKSHGQWNLIFTYSIPAIAIFVAGFVILIRWITSLI
jgi:hypothetical protein